MNSKKKSRSKDGKLPELSESKAIHDAPNETKSASAAENHEVKKTQGSDVGCPHDEIKIYVEAATAASDRGRLVLLVTITISVLAFSAYWNARQESWLNSRLHMARIASVGCKNDWDAAKIQSQLRAEDKLLLPQAREYYEARHFDNCDNVAEAERNLDEIQAKEVNQVKVPFFGSQFDVNDLGMFAGFSFVVTLIWFRYSLAREYNNLVLCFSAVGKQDRRSKKTVYDLLAMRQVMTVPPPLEEEPMAQHKNGRKKGKRLVSFPWNRFSLILYLLPLGVQFLIVQSDWKTSLLGESISNTNKRIVNFSEAGFLILIVILTSLCVWLAHKIDEKWEHMAKQYRSFPVPANAAENPVETAQSRQAGDEPYGH